MKKMLIGLLFGLMVVSGSAFATVDCTAGVTPCSFVTPAGDVQPAVTFSVTADQLVQLHIDLYQDSIDCSTTSTPIDGALQLTAGQNIVYLNFDPPLPAGTMFSATWVVDGCPVTDCTTYVIGQQPPACGAGAGANVTSLDVQY